MGRGDGDDDLSTLDVPEGCSTEAVHRVVADPDRRLLLRLLGDLETPEQLTALVRNLAMHTDRTDEEAIERLRIELRHVHVPLLESHGLVRYYGGSQRVELTEAGETLAAQLPLSG